MKIKKWKGSPVKIEITHDLLSVEFDESKFLDEVVNNLPSFTFVIRDKTSKQIVRDVMWKTLLELHKEIASTLIDK